MTPYFVVQSAYIYVYQDVLSDNEDSGSSSTTSPLSSSPQITMSEREIRTNLFQRLSKHSILCSYCLSKSKQVFQRLVRKGLLQQVKCVSTVIQHFQKLLKTSTH